MFCTRLPLQVSGEFFPHWTIQDHKTSHRSRDEDKTQHMRMFMQTFSPRKHETLLFAGENVCVIMTACAGIVPPCADIDQMMAALYI